MTVNRSRILHRDPRHALPVAVGGDGPFVIDSAGRRYLDASGGAAVSCLGHSDRRVIDAIKAQLDRLPYAHTGFFTNEPAEALAEHLIARAPGDLGHVYFVSGGSEANETAMKLARQYFYERGETGRRHFIARRQSYHGNTIAALSVGGNAGRRAIYEPILLPATHIAPCFEYRHRHEDESPEDYGLRAANALEAEILRLGPETVIAFIAETVVGATVGAVTPAPGYLPRIREICDKYGVLLILDEVMSGMGRLGALYGCDLYGIAPDILTCAKGLGAGYQPIGAVLMSERIHDAITEGSGAFQHGFTYIGHATACAGALAVQRVIEDDGLLANCRRRGEALRAALGAAFGGRPWFGDLRGEGLFIGLELVADRATKRPFDPGLKLHAKVKAAAMAEGLMCYPMGGTADGVAGDHVLLAPPFIIDDSHIEMIVTRLGRAIGAALAEAGGGMIPFAIAVAPNGARRGKADHPRLPITAAEIARDAAESLEAGASMIHLHVRDAAGAHVLDAGLYRQAVAAVKAAVGDRLVIQITTEAVGRYTPAEQIALIDELGPESVSIALREILPEGGDERPAAALFQRMERAGLLHQIIVYEAAELARLDALAARGVLPDGPLAVQAVLGRKTGTAADPAEFDARLAAGIGRHAWMLCAFGPRETEFMARAARSGGHARVGFENNLWLPDGTLAPSNAAIVAATVAAAGSRPIASAEDLRQSWRTPLSQTPGDVKPITPPKDPTSPKGAVPTKEGTT